MPTNYGRAFGWIRRWHVLASDMASATSPVEVLHARPHFLHQSASDIDSFFYDIHREERFVQYRCLGKGVCGFANVLRLSERKCFRR